VLDLAASLRAGVSVGSETASQPEPRLNTPGPCGARGAFPPLFSAGRAMQRKGPFASLRACRLRSGLSAQAPLRDRITATLRPPGLTVGNSFPLVAAHRSARVFPSLVTEIPNVTIRGGGHERCRVWTFGRWRQIPLAGAFFFAYQAVAHCCWGGSVRTCGHSFRVNPSWRAPGAEARAALRGRAPFSAAGLHRMDRSRSR